MRGETFQRKEKSILEYPGINVGDQRGKAEDPRRTELYNIQKYVYWLIA